MATAVIAGDLSASLGFYLSAEVVRAFENILSLHEVAMLALASTVVFGAAPAFLSRWSGALPDLLLRSLTEATKTAAFLSGSVSCQLAIRLVSGSIGQPFARVVSVLTTLLLLRTVLFSVDLSRHELVYTRQLAAQRTE